MKQESIEARKAKRKKDAVLGVLGFAALQGVSAAVFWCLCLIPDAPSGLVWCLRVLGALCLLLIVPALCALKGRFREIEGGELDASGKY